MKERLQSMYAFQPLLSTRHTCSVYTNVDLVIFCCRQFPVFAVQGIFYLVVGGLQPIEYQQRCCASGVGLGEIYGILFHCLQVKELVPNQIVVVVPVDYT